MDEQRLSELFAAAAAEPPPAAFDASDVRAESARVTARNRRRLAGGAFAVLVLGGVGTGIGVVAGSDDSGGAGDSVAIYADSDGAESATGGAARELAAAPVPGHAPQADAADVPEARASQVPPCGAVDDELVRRFVDLVRAQGVSVQGTGPSCVDDLAAQVLQVPGGTLTLVFGPVADGLQRTGADGTVFTLSSSGPLLAELRTIADELAH